MGVLFVYGFIYFFENIMIIFFVYVWIELDNNIFNFFVFLWMFVVSCLVRWKFRIVLICFFCIVNVFLFSLVCFLLLNLLLFVEWIFSLDC